MHVAVMCLSLSHGTCFTGEPSVTVYTRCSLICVSMELVHVLLSEQDVLRKGLSSVSPKPQGALALPDRVCDPC